jgi:hypothetical protein
MFLVVVVWVFVVWGPPKAKVQLIFFIFCHLFWPPNNGKTSPPHVSPHLHALPNLSYR